MDVATAAKLAEIPLDEFMALNPAYNRPLIPDNGNTALVLPADRVSVFQTNLVRHERQEKPLSLWKTTVLKPKEKLDAVAARYGISTARLKQFNSIGPRTKVKPGLTLLVPASPAAAQEITANMPQPPVEEPPVVRNTGRTAAKGRQAARSPSKHEVSAPRGKGKVTVAAKTKGSGGAKPAKPQGKAPAPKSKGKKH
jgi:membrane-bound lytic murein transglycosylase D